ncbi:MAG: B12-binding domain-containing radical SAM protein [Nitrospinae bacterium]|nr:B12-binding domain-containing radical SAM protein [Nitrospinota bacterium]
MRIAFYNPPAATPVIRRYMCSYNAGENLYPNIELLGLAAHAESEGHTAVYIDCIAEGFGGSSGLAALKTFRPDVVVSLLGLECFGADIAEMLAVKGELPEAKVGIMGYYATMYPEKCVEKGMDFVLLGEGEQGLSGYLKGDLAAPGLATKERVNRDGRRLSEDEYNRLPHPAHHLIKPGAYGELGLGSPLTVAQFTRGCPYPCSYCVRSYGRKTVNRSVENVLKELEDIARLGIRYVRFLDDTFTTDKKWAAAICEGIVQRGIKLAWGALSRADTLDGELLKLMKRAGCRRIFIGIESGSQRVLDYYKKGYKVERIPSSVRLARKAGLETVGFFLLGAPFETIEDVQQSMDMARKCDLDYVIVTKLVIYPGTELENELRDMAAVDPWEGVHRFADEKREMEILEWERLFYRSFYTSYSGIRTGVRTLFRQPVRTLRAAASIMRFALSSGQDKSHPDYL